MKSTCGLRAAMVALALASVTLSGCIVEEPRYRPEVVTVAPPAPQVEVVGVAPAPGYVWIGGYWDWAAGRHVWVPGRWEPGRPGYHWVPHHWVAYRGGWRLDRGHWAR